MSLFSTTPRETSSASRNQLSTTRPRHDTRTRRTSRNRRMFLELLEDRRLLSIDLVSIVDPSFGAISGNNNSSWPTISADGRYVALIS